MNYKQFLVVMLGFILLYNCTNSTKEVTTITAKNITISDSLTLQSDIEAYIKPYRMQMAKNMNRVISFSPATYSKKDGDFNTALGNLFADAVLQQGNVVFTKRTGKSIDMVLLNSGGIRSILSKGNITVNSAFKLMPFENSIVVVKMKGKTIKDSLIAYLSKAKKAHPIAGLQLTINKSYHPIKFTINGKAINDTTSYYIATNDYLYNGGDNMTFFKTNDSLYTLDYKIRNALIDYFEKKDTINPIIDSRFIQVP